MRPLLLLLLLPVVASAAELPTQDDWYAMAWVGDPAVSPDGRFVAFEHTTNAFEADLHLTQLHLVPVAGGAPRVLTRGEQPLGEWTWSPDGRWIAFLREETLHVLPVDGGEPVILDAGVEGIGSLAFAPDGAHLYFLAGPGEQPALEARKERYGDYAVVREDGPGRELWRLPLTDGMTKAGDAERLTADVADSVVEFAVSPDGDSVALVTWPTPYLADLLDGRVLLLDPETGTTRRVDDTTGGKSGLVWHVDGEGLAWTNAEGFPTLSDLQFLDVDAGTVRTHEMTELDPQPVRWDDDGLWFLAPERTTAGLYRLDDDGELARISPEDVIHRDFTVSDDGAVRAYLAADATHLSEVVVDDTDGTRTLTDVSAQLDGFALPSKEIVRWTSFDGLAIEGVLTRPPGFDPERRYPLIVRTHGGPTGIDFPWIAGAPRGIYEPAVLAGLGGGSLVLQTNYRGSAAYGEAFQSSNLRQLGIGPARDIVAGIDVLTARGIVDPTRVGCLGWSQGGHISAMLATYTDACTTAIMGAGISDWRTYYYNTDITQFTVEYFGATPFDDPDVYALTSPVTYLDEDATPVLIQHGETDARVPIANGYQLRQALLDAGVEARMLVYSGMGHGPRTPRTTRAIAEHAVAWLDHQLFGAEAPDFVTPVEPEADEDDEAAADGAD
jgi:dipeptidyl aminopeptidase/acylaminoacyl peptidase